MTSRRFWVRMVIDSDLSPRLRFAFEFAAVVVIVMVLTGIAVREFVHLVDRAIVSEAPSMIPGERNWNVVEYALTGRWLADRETQGAGQYVSDVRMTEEGHWIASFRDDRGSPTLRGRQITWRLQSTSPWDANVFFWACQPEGQFGSSVVQASLPTYC
mgnify:CR=1 FL=1